MDFTFGIITDGNNDSHISQIINTIERENIPKYEIIIVGNSHIKRDKTQVIPFDESIKPKWITRKKNIIYAHSIYENIVMLHDYVCLEQGWYDNFVKFGNDFGICVTKIKNSDGSRYLDYTVFPLWNTVGVNLHLPESFNSKCLLPYDFINNQATNKYVYVPGNYFIIKRHMALRFPLDEKLVWGQGEDVLICKKLSDNGVLIQCNAYSSVKFLKWKHPVPWNNIITHDQLEYLTKMSRLITI